MAHNRTSIRDALVALLTPALSVTLYSERRQPIDSTLRPLAILTLGDDTIETDQLSMGSPVYDVEHGQAFALEVHTEGATGLDVAEAIDAIELEIEAALASDIELGGLVEMIYPVSSEFETETEQDRVIGVRTLNYLAPWRSKFGAPDTPEA